MSVELRPLNVRCNLQCLYCYQHPQRDLANARRTYDLERMKAAIEAEGGPFTLFGGEPLLLPLKDLEALWQWGVTKYGKNAIQTNGTLISDQHIDLIRKYRVHVGISIDGPGELNDVRWCGSLAKTRENTARTESAIDRLCREGLPPSLITTLHRGNATAEKLPILIEWARALHLRGISSLRLHLLESESPEIRARFALSAEENSEALLAFLRSADGFPGLRIDLFSDMRRLLVGNDRGATCTWVACDPYTTVSVHGIEGEGQRSNCGRIDKDGVSFVKSSTVGFERCIALYHTPQEVGGCMGCRFFLMCKGQCPGEAIDGDWRNRTEHCRTWKTLFEVLEYELLAEGTQPLSVRPVRVQIERKAMEQWSKGHAVSIADLLELQSGATAQMTASTTSQSPLPGVT